ncbi:helix-turn-helix domain-containing protein [Bacteroidota bacterium]
MIQDDPCRQKNPVEFKHEDNHDLNQHFFDFGNGYRIRKAMEMFVDPGKKEVTVLEILYDIGFNSKSSFNTAFKKYTQLIPAECRI